MNLIQQFIGTVVLLITYANSVDAFEQGNAGLGIGLMVIAIIALFIHDQGVRKEERERIRS